MRLAAAVALASIFQSGTADRAHLDPSLPCCVFHQAAHCNVSMSVEFSSSCIASYELFRTDCGGKAIFMEGSAFEQAGELPILAEVMELLHTMIDTRGQMACPDWSDEEYRELQPRPSCRLESPSRGGLQAPAVPACGLPCPLLFAFESLAHPVPALAHTPAGNLYSPQLFLVRMLESMSSTAPTPYSSECAARVGDNNLVGLEALIENYEETLGQAEGNLPGGHWEGTSQCPEDIAMTSDCPPPGVLSPETAPEDGVPVGSACNVASTLDLLPNTCTSAGMLDGGCSMQIPLDALVGTPDLNLQIAFGTCPSSLLPFMSLRIGGTGATTLLAPCSSDDDCGQDHTCFDMFGVANEYEATPEGGTAYDEMARDFLEFVGYQGDQNATMEAIMSVDVGSGIMTAIRKFYDDQAITLRADQLFPMCLPQGGATGAFDWDEAGGACASRWGEHDETGGDGMRAADCEALSWQECEHFSRDVSSHGCTLFSGDGIDPYCSYFENRITHSNAHQTYEFVPPPPGDCEGMTTDECAADFMCHWATNGGVVPSPTRIMEGLEMPLENRQRSFEAGNGLTYTCGEHQCEEDSCNPVSEWVISPDGYSKCASIGYASFSAEMFVAQTRGDAGTCTRYTAISLAGVLEPWDGRLADGTSVFDLKDTPSLIPAGTPMDDTWYASTCDGLFVARVSDRIFGAYKAPALFPIFEEFALMFRTIILGDAANADECVTDEQIQSFFTPWSVQYWLTAVSAWGPTEDDTPALLPTLESVGKEMMEAYAAEAKDDSQCPVVCHLDVDCWDENCEIPDGMEFGSEYHFPSEDNYRIEECGWQRHRDPSCLGPHPGYPSFTLPSTCTAAGYSAEPSNGCAASYDLSWATGGETLSVDFAVAKCAHNPISLSATRIMCGDDDLTALCNYGHGWCDGEHDCADPQQTCEPFPPELLDDSNWLDRNDDPVSSFMGDEVAADGFEFWAPFLESLLQTSSHRARWVLLPAPPGWEAPTLADQTPEDILATVMAATDTIPVLDSGDMSRADETHFPPQDMSVCHSESEMSSQYVVVFSAPPEILCSGPDGRCHNPTDHLFYQAAPANMDCEWSSQAWTNEVILNSPGFEVLTHVGLCTPNMLSGSMSCEYQNNTKVPSGPVAKEVINFIRGLFGDTPYPTLPAGLGYCVPEDPGFDPRSEDPWMEDPGDLVRQDEDTDRVSLVGLNSWQLPDGLGDAGLDVVSMDPPYGQETCGLVYVQEVVIAATTHIPGAVSAEALQTALASAAPAGATVTITSIETSVESTFELPAGTELDLERKMELREQIATAYGGSAHQVELDGVRRRRLQDDDAIAVTFTFTTTQSFQSPDTTALTDAITAATGAAPISVADPATAAVSTNVQYTVTIQRDGTEDDDVAELVAQATNTAALAAPLDGQVTDVGGGAIDTNTLTAGLTATQVGSPVAVRATTTQVAAEAAGLQTVAAVAAPVAAPSTGAPSTPPSTPPTTPASTSRGGLASFVGSMLVTAAAMLELVV